jgi:hypothetical protein
MTEPTVKELKAALGFTINVVRERDARIAELEAALSDTTAHLVAAVSLLERGGKKAAPSNKMFEQMLDDHKNSIERGRAALEKK